MRIHCTKSLEEIHPPKTRGFTLIELLVVVAIIAILASLLLSAITGAKREAQKIVCLNNLKQWNYGLQMYAHDNDDYIPREGHRRETAGTVEQDMWADVINPENVDVVYNALPKEYLKGVPASYYASKFTGRRAEFYKDKIFHCPAANFVPGKETRPEAFFSLPMNSKLIQPPDLTIKFKDIKLRSSTVAFLDGRVSVFEAKAVPDQTDDSLGQPSVFASRAAPRHSGRINLTFCDGHARTVAGIKVVAGPADPFPGGAIFSTFRGNDIIWSADPSKNPNLKDTGP